MERLWFWLVVSRPMLFDFDLTVFEVMFWQLILFFDLMDYSWLINRFGSGLCSHCRTGAEYHGHKGGKNLLHHDDQLLPAVVEIFITPGV